jgi:tetratricopeptide (TPR) repeat protein
MFRAVLLAILLVMANDSLAQTTTVSQTESQQLPAFDKLWDYNKPAETETKFREVWAQTEASADANYKLELLTQIGRTQGLQTKFEDAHKTLDEVEQQLNALPQDPPTRARLRYELERGRTYNSSNKKQEAIQNFNRALEIANKLGEENLAVDAVHMLGIATNGDESLAWNEKAVEMAEKATDPKTKGWLGALYNNIGWTYHDMEKYDVALRYFEKDLVWYQERNFANQSRIAKWSIAKMHRLLGDATTAFKEQQAIKAEMDSAGVEEDGYIYEELGECAIALDRDEDEWKAYIQKAYELLSKDAWSVSQEPKKHERLRKLLGID